MKILQLCSCILFLVACAVADEEEDNIFSVFGSRGVENPEDNKDPTACKTPTNEDGKCIHYERCSSARKSNAKFHINDRFNPCDTYRTMCCVEKDIIPEGGTPEVTTATVARGCGHRNKDGVGFSYEGKTLSDKSAQFGEFPWMISLLKREFKLNGVTILMSYLCGGALLHPGVVLTAAHCVYSLARRDPPLVARAGEWDSQTQQESLTYDIQDVLVQAIVTHEDYDDDNLHNDVSVLFLKTPFTLAPHIGVVCLPERSSSYEARDCYGSGWGKNIFGKKGVHQAILKKVKMPTVEHGKCQRALQMARLTSRFSLHASFMCAGGEANQDMCEGDGGSPLVCPTKNNPSVYEQVGVVSWGLDCGLRGVPGVYASLPKLRPWIDAQLLDHSIDMTQYRP